MYILVIWIPAIPAGRTLFSWFYDERAGLRFYKSSVGWVASFRNPTFWLYELLATPTLKISPCGRNDSIIATLRKTAE
jgi:hypothetical protein